MPDPKILAERLEKATQTNAELGSRLTDVFPATRAFLDARGVASVRDLDAQGRADLKAHLEAALKEARSQNTEGP